MFAFFIDQSIFHEREFKEYRRFYVVDLPKKIQASELSSALKVILMRILLLEDRHRMLYWRNNKFDLSEDDKEKLETKESLDDLIREVKAQLNEDKSSKNSIIDGGAKPLTGSFSENFKKELAFETGFLEKVYAYFHK